MRPHHIGARGALHAPQEAASLFSCTLEILRQTTLQVYERDLCKPTAGPAANASTQLKQKVDLDSSLKST